MDFNTNKLRIKMNDPSLEGIEQQDKDLVSVLISTLNSFYLSKGIFPITCNVVLDDKNFYTVVCKYPEKTVITFDEMLALKNISLVKIDRIYTVIDQSEEQAETKKLSICLCVKILRSSSNISCSQYVTEIHRVKRQITNQHTDVVDKENNKRIKTET